MTPEIVARRLRAQLLSGPPLRDVGAAVEQILAVQAQDPRGARLAVRARTSGLTAAHVDRALTDERSVVITWLNRGTLHLVRGEDYWWLQPLTTPQLATANARRLKELGVTVEHADRAVNVIEQALTEDGPRTRTQLRDRIAAAGVTTEGQAFVHLLFRAALHGVAVRGPMAGRQHAFALVRDWLGKPPPPLERETSLARLAHRYLVGHGPATDADLAKWAGITLRDARTGLSGIASAIEELGGGLVDLAGRHNVREMPVPRLLGAFEPILCGWAVREPLLAMHQPVVMVGGMFKPFALARGRAVGLWRLEGRDVVIEPLEAIDEDDRAALEADSVDVLRFLGQ